MTADSQWPFQVAVRTALLADATLTAIVGTRVFDHTPQDTDFPYVVMGESSGSEFDTKSEEGMEQTIMIHSWSRYRGLKETKDIIAAIIDVLDKAALLVSGHTLVDLRFEFSDTIPQDDGFTRHGVMRFKAKTTKP